MVREHAIPVGHIYGELVEAIRMERTQAELQDAKRRLDAEMAAVHAKAGAFSGFPSNARIAFVVDIIRAATTLAWLTQDEDKLLNKKLGDGSASLKNRMPPGWDGKDPLARYDFCGIKVFPTID